MSKHGRKSIPLQKSATSAALNVKSQMKGLLEQAKAYKEAIRQNGAAIEASARMLIKALQDPLLLEAQRNTLCLDIAEVIIERAKAAQR